MIDQSLIKLFAYKSNGLPLQSSIIPTFPPNIKVENFDKSEHFVDKNSYTYDSIFRFPGEFPQDNVRIACYDWSESLPYTDHLNVSIILSEYDKWLEEL